MQTRGVESDSWGWRNRLPLSRPPRHAGTVEIICGDGRIAVRLDAFRRITARCSSAVEKLRWSRDDAPMLKTLLLELLATMCILKRFGVNSFTGGLVIGRATWREPKWRFVVARRATRSFFPYPPPRLRSSSRRPHPKRRAHTSTSPTPHRLFHIYADTSRCMLFSVNTAASHLSYGRQLCTAYGASC